MGRSTNLQAIILYVVCFRRNVPRELSSELCWRDAADFAVPVVLRSFRDSVTRLMNGEL